MVWPPAASDIDPIENIYGLSLRDVYDNGKQYSSKENLWEATKLHK